MHKHKTSHFDIAFSFNHCYQISVIFIYAIIKVLTSISYNSILFLSLQASHFAEKIKSVKNRTEKKKEKKEEKKPEMY